MEKTSQKTHVFRTWVKENGIGTLLVLILLGVMIVMAVALCGVSVYGFNISSGVYRIAAVVGFIFGAAFFDFARRNLQNIVNDTRVEFCEKD